MEMAVQPLAKWSMDMSAGVDLHLTMMSVTKYVEMAKYLVYNGVMMGIMSQVMDAVLFVMLKEDGHVVVEVLYLRILALRYVEMEWTCTTMSVMMEI
jgi:hypothetical protein